MVIWGRIRQLKRIQYKTTASEVLKESIHDLSYSIFAQYIFFSSVYIIFITVRCMFLRLWGVIYLLICLLFLWLLWVCCASFCSDGKQSSTSYFARILYTFLPFFPNVKERKFSITYIPSVRLSPARVKTSSLFMVLLLFWTATTTPPNSNYTVVIETKTKTFEHLFHCYYYYD